MGIDVGTTMGVGSASGAGVGTGVGAVGPVCGTDAMKLTKFEGFLTAAGHAVGVLLADIVKFALPIAVVLSNDPGSLTAGEQAFVEALRMVLNAVILIEQKWASLGAATGAQKLADVLQIVEGPITALFAQAGLLVEATYITSLVNAVVTLLNAQPAVTFGGPPMSV